MTAALLAAVECSVALTVDPKEGYAVLARHGFVHNPDLREADYSQACAFVEAMCRSALASAKGLL